MKAIGFGILLLLCACSSNPEIPSSPQNNLPDVSVTADTTPHNDLSSKDASQEDAHYDTSQEEDADRDTSEAQPDAFTDADVPDVTPEHTCVAPSRPSQAGDFVLEPSFADILTAEQTQRLIDLVPAPHEAKRWYLAQQGGQVWTFHEEEPEATLVFDIADQLWIGHSESGLVSIALHPDFASNQYVFVVYSAPDENAQFVSRLARYTVPIDGSEVDPSSAQIILDLPQYSPSHSGNHIRFGRDGYLYYAVGDGGRSSDRANGQNLNTRKASILRIDVDRSESSTRAYAIPEDNPFPDTEAPEVYAYGLRNVWRFSFDQETGELWAGDVGDLDWEEINRIEAGANYGWSIQEGASCYRAEACENEDLRKPLWSYGHSVGRSVTGGYVYRGSAVPALVGHYLFADFINGNVWSLRQEGDAPPTVKLQVETGLNISGFAQAPSGETYVLVYSRGLDGQILKISPVSDDFDAFPKRLSETGCLNPTNPRLPAHRVFDYDVRAQLWSDGAEKERFFSIPEGTHITVDARGNLIFPVGSVVIKHFKTQERYLETRFMMHHEDGWGGYTYAWNAAQDDGELLTTGQTIDLGMEQQWNYPSRGQCSACHTEIAQRTLGLELLQLNADADEEQDTEDQLQRWIDEGLFGPDVASAADLGASSFPAMARPFGAEAPIDTRARAYLHANCSNCHQPDGPGRAAIDLLYTTPFANTGLCDAEPEHGVPWYLPGSDTMKLIVPGDSGQSILLHRLDSLRQLRMPPLASHSIDHEGVALLHTWITMMEGPCPEPF